MGVTNVYNNVAAISKAIKQNVVGDLVSGANQKQNSSTFFDELQQTNATLNNSLLSSGKQMELETVKQISGSGSIESTAIQLNAAKTQLDITAKALSVFAEKFNELISRVMQG
jgi:K+-transporting ATPase c subunit